MRPWGPSHKNVPPGGQALRLPRAGLEVGAHGPCGLLACPMPISLRLAPRPGPQLAPRECLNNQMPTMSGTGTWLPLTLTSSPLHTCRADSPIAPSLEPRNLSLCLVKGTLGLLQIMGSGQLIKGEGAYYRCQQLNPFWEPTWVPAAARAHSLPERSGAESSPIIAGPPEAHSARPRHKADSFLKQNPEVLAGLPHPPRLGGGRVSQWEPCFLISLVFKN